MAHRDDRMLLVWPLLTAVFDFGVLTGSFMLSYHIRFSEWFYAHVVPLLFFPATPFEMYKVSAFIWAAIIVLSMAFAGVYKVSFRISTTHEIAFTLYRYFLGWALLAALLFFYRELEYSRLVAMISLFLGGFGLILIRLIISAIREKVFRRNPLHRALVVGPLADAISSRLESSQRTGLSVIGKLTAPERDKKGLRKFIADKTPDTIVLAYPFNEFSVARSVIEMLEGKRLIFLYAPEPAGFSPGRLATITIAGVPVIRLREDPVAGWNGLLKRSFDLVMSSILIALISPILAVLALAVKFSSPGPVIFKQTRVGLDNRPFTILKYRSMRTDAEDKTGPVWAKPGDARTTKTGAWLRRWSLDELPQLFNVFTGDMSLVGPRPERPEFVSEFEEVVPQYNERHRVRAGMTGWAQVNGLRGQVPIEQRTKYDVYYVENWSLGLDLMILARTLVAVVAGRDAY
jgi:exopolysaccharide biosynthesis polyprenyl glycosylphosphotransferase